MFVHLEIINTNLLTISGQQLLLLGGWWLAAALIPKGSKIPRAAALNQPNFKLRLAIINIPSLLLWWITQTHHRQSSLDQPSDLYKQLHNKQYFNSYNTRSIKSYKLLCYHLILKLRYSSLELFNYKFFKSLASIAIDPIDIFSMYRIVRRIKHYSLNTVSIHSFSHKPVLLIRSLNRFNHHLVSSTPLSTSSFNLSYSLRFTSLLSLQTCISS